jgi:hypothetical protein
MWLYKVSREIRPEAFQRHGAIFFPTSVSSNAFCHRKMSPDYHGINMRRDDIFNGEGNCLPALLAHHLHLQPALPLMRVSARQLPLPSQDSQGPNIISFVISAIAIVIGMMLAQSTLFCLRI